jgi:nucleoid-associated protein YgaU
MNLNRFFFIVLAALLFIFAEASLAQQKMKKEEAEKKIQELTAERDKLKAQDAALGKEVEDLKAKSAQMDKDYEKCIDDLYAMVGATRADIDAFRKRLSDMEAKVDDMSKLDDKTLYERRAEVDELNNDYKKNVKGSKISLLPEFFDRVQALGPKIDPGLRRKPTEQKYTVGTWAKDRDCLWNISKKPTIYDNAFLWPKIWMGNRDLIKDPDIIRPGWELLIPEKGDGKLSDDESKSARRYYSSKKAKMESGTTMPKDMKKESKKMEEKKEGTK